VVFLRQPWWRARQLTALAAAFGIRRRRSDSNRAAL
jgi:hypothetical protein